MTDGRHIAVSPPKQCNGPQGCARLPNAARRPAVALNRSVKDQKSSLCGVSAVRHPVNRINSTGLVDPPERRRAGRARSFPRRATEATVDAVKSPARTPDEAHLRPHPVGERLAGERRAAGGQHRSEARRLDHGRQVPAHRSARKSLLIGMITEVTRRTSAGRARAGLSRHRAPRPDGRDQAAATTARRYFQRGVTDYPAIGDPADADQRATSCGSSTTSPASDTIDIGHLQQDARIGAYVNVDEMLSKHFAVLGTTGVGKSSGVALILREILEARPNLRIFLLDAPQRIWPLLRRPRAGAQSAQSQAAVLAVQFRGDRRRLLRRPARRRGGGRDPLRGDPARQGQLHAATAARPTAPTLKQSDPKTTGYTVDTPVPYRLADLVALIDERMGKLENRSSRMKYHKLITRIETRAQRPALRLHVRQRQCRRRHHGGGAAPAVPAAGRTASR